MVGMLQIITYLLCIYLIFKGFEILQIALMSNREDRSAGMILGTLLLVIAIGAAAMFVKMIDAQASAVGSHSSRP
jgi:hypothetical protein